VWRIEVAATPAVVKVRLGNLFEGPSDLIVLPCSTLGTVTGFVARSLAHFAIPRPREGMMLGEIDVVSLDGGENLAQYAAFAASACATTRASSVEAIEAIGRALGDVTKCRPVVRLIAAPLLGAGAGGLEEQKVVGALKRGFLAGSDGGASLIIHVLEKPTFERLKVHREARSPNTNETLRVFISHTSQSAKASEWVMQLALYLLDHGIQARLDKLHLRRGMDLPQWMCNELALAHKVIVVCDENYRQKADGRVGGVGWETMIIQGDLANLPPDSTKYQVVVRSEDIHLGMPMYLRTRYAHHARPSDETQSFRETLLRELLDLPLDDRLEQREFAV
jgi:hypothetical protein